MPEPLFKPRAEVSAPEDLMGLEKRVVGVERAMNLTVNLLRQLIRRQQPPSTSATQQSR